MDWPVYLLLATSIVLAKARNGWVSEELIPEKGMKIPSQQCKNWCYERTVAEIGWDKQGCWIRPFPNPFFTVSSPLSVKLSWFLEFEILECRYRVKRVRGFACESPLLAPPGSSKFRNLSLQMKVDAELFRKTTGIWCQLVIGVVPDSVLLTYLSATILAQSTLAISLCM